jgi:hypothetical protein
MCYANTVLWCDCCKIHHFEAAPRKQASLSHKHIDTQNTHLFNMPLNLQFSFGETDVPIVFEEKERFKGLLRGNLTLQKHLIVIVVRYREEGLVRYSLHRNTDIFYYAKHGYILRLSLKPAAR